MSFRDYKAKICTSLLETSNGQGDWHATQLVYKTLYSPDITDDTNAQYFNVIYKVRILLHINF